MGNTHVGGWFGLVAGLVHFGWRQVPCRRSPLPAAGFLYGAVFFPRH